MNAATQSVLPPSIVCLPIALGPIRRPFPARARGALPCRKQNAISNRQTVSSSARLKHPEFSYLTFSNRQNSVIRRVPRNQAIRGARGAGSGGLQSRKGAPKITAFMKFVGDRTTIFKPGAARWASLFIANFSTGIYVAPPSRRRISLSHTGLGAHRSSHSILGAPEPNPPSCSHSLRASGISARRCND
jgi:hypothetical protein